MKVDIGIIGAMSSEVEIILAGLADKNCESISGIDFYIGRLGEKTVAVAKCGVGKVFAATCAQTMIIRYSPKLLINTGVGGAIASGISTGDVVIADSLVQHDMDTSAIGDPVGLVSGINKIYFEADERAAKILLSTAEKLGYTARLGRKATGDIFVASKEDKKRISELFSASACEMEGGAIAQVAFVNETPFAVIRAISDNADGEATMDFPTFLPIAAERSSMLAMALAAEY